MLAAYHAQKPARKLAGPRTLAFSPMSELAQGQNERELTQNPRRDPKNWAYRDNLVGTGEVRLQLNVPLGPMTTLRVGGAASHFVRATEHEEVSEAIRFAEREGLSLYVLGGGSNLVIADSGVRGLVLQPALPGVEFRAQGSDVMLTAGAGVTWDALVDEAVQRDLQGLECLSGIPGFVGATPIQNVGAYGQEVSETIEQVCAIDRRTGEQLEFSNAACQFNYRNSFFKSTAEESFLVTRVTFRLSPHRKAAVRYADLERFMAARNIVDTNLVSTRNAVLELRRAKSMVLDPADRDARSCGSFFLNPLVDSGTLAVLQRNLDAPIPSFLQTNGDHKLPAAWLIEHAGFSKGQRSGAVGLSSKHCLAIVAHPSAQALDVVSFARTVQHQVQAAFGIRLSPEPNFWGFDQLVDGLPAASH